MDIEDAHALALQIVGRSDEQPAVKPSREQQQAKAEEPTGGWPRELQEGGRVGHARPPGKLLPPPPPPRQSAPADQPLRHGVGDRRRVLTARRALRPDLLQPPR